MRKFLSIGMLLSFFIWVSCEEVLFEENLDDKTVVLIAPSDRTTVVTTTVNFSWEAVDQATAYRLQIAQPDFILATQVVQDTTISGTSFSMALSRNSYQWRVRAQNSGSATSYATASFRTMESEDFSARIVPLTSPVADAITNTTTISLQWQAVTDATLYRVQLLNTSGTVIQEETTTATRLQPTFPEGASTWQVRAESNSQNTAYTSRSITIDTQNPRKPVLTAPVDQSSQTDTEVNFTWTREAVAGTTEIDSIYIYRDMALTQLETKQQATTPTAITLTANTYYWVVRAFDAAKNQSEASDTFRFTIN